MKIKMLRIKNHIVHHRAKYAVVVTVPVACYITFRVTRSKDIYVAFNRMALNEVLNYLGENHPEILNDYFAS